MAGMNIQGINIRLGAETTAFDKALKDIGKQTANMNKELREVDKLLKFNPSNTVLLAQKQQLLTNQIENTATKLDALKQAQKQVEQQFASGEIGEEQYRKFQRELVNTEGALGGLQNKLASLKAEQEKVAESTKDLSTYFEATGTSVEDFAMVLGTKLTNAIKEGKASSQELGQALDKIGQYALGTDANIGKFKQALKGIDDGGSLDTVRKELQDVSNEAKESQKAVKEFEVGIGNVASGLVAGGGVAGAISQALDVSSLNTKIDVSFNVPEESVGSIKEAARNVTKYGLDAEEALEGIRRQWALNKDASDEANRGIIESAGVVASAYSGIDFIELVQEINEIGAAIGISNEEAIALTNSLLKTGFPSEQLDIISEYGTQMKEAGFSAAEIQHIFEQGIDTKTWNIDNLMDGVKEVRLQMASFGSGVSKELKPLIEAAGISSEQFQEWGVSVAKGGEEGSKALSDMVTWLNGIEDATAKNELATAAFGTKWEDQGQNMTAVFTGLSDAQDKTVQNQEQLNNAINSMNTDPSILMKEAMGELQATLAPTLTVLADVVGTTANWIKENSTLASTIIAVVSSIGIIGAGLTALAPIVIATTTAAGALGVSVGAIAAPIGIAVAAIAGLVAGGVLLYKNWDTIKEKAGEIANWIPKKFEELKDGALNSVEKLKTSATTKFNELTTGLKNKVTGTKDSVVTAFENLKQGVITKITNAKDTAISTFETLRSSISTKATSIVTNTKDSFNKAKDAIIKPIEDAKDKVGEIVDKIKGFFTNLKMPEIKMPKLKMPHFSITGNFSLNPPSVPKIGVEWYAKGGIMTDPTVFGRNGNNFMVGGEAGREAILPLTASVLGNIGKGIYEQMQPQSQNIVINPAPIYLDGQLVGEAVFDTVNGLHYNSASMYARTKGGSF